MSFQRAMAQWPRPTAPRGSQIGVDDEAKLLNLWDAVWFGDDAVDCCSSSSPRTLKSAFTADPLDNVVPVASYEPLLSALQPNGLPTAVAALPAPPQSQQQPSQSRMVAAATSGHQGQQQQHIQQLQEPPMLRYSAAQPAAAAAAIPTAPQARAVSIPSNGAAAATAASRGGPIADRSPEQQQVAQLQEQQEQQEQQQQQHPAPFVLGTWAQRQYIMPVQRPAAQANGAAPAGEEPSASTSSQQRASTSPARPIPKGKYPSSNGSSRSSGASTRGKPAANGVHSSSGTSSEEAPAAAVLEANAAAEAAAAAAEAAAMAAMQVGAGAAVNVDDAAAVELWQDAAAAQAGRRSMGTDDEDEAVQQIAWRWRFARRWQAEQARMPLDPAAAGSPGDGGMEEALQYLAACGENWHHLSRGSSQLGTVDSRLLGTLGSLGCLGAELLADDGSFSIAGSGYGMQGTLQDTADSGGALAASCASRDASMTGEGAGRGRQQHQQQQQQQPLPGQPLGQQQQQRRRQQQRSGLQPPGEATVQVNGITKRAQQLLEAQNGINQAVKERWRQVSAVQGPALWVGALLEAVQVDPWGKFKFLLLRMKDRNGRQMLLVRGSNNATDAKIVEELHREMMAACGAHDLPAESIEVLGGGVMEWTQHRDRHLHISGGYVSRTSSAGGPSTATEVMRLAAVLTQQVLPMHYKVTSAGGKQLI